MPSSKILVTGPTGATGSAAVVELMQRGHEIRALAHRQDERSDRLKRAGAEVVFGDLLDFDEVRSALKGIQRAYFVYPIRPGIVQATAQFAQAAKEAGVDAVVNMSQKSAREDSLSISAQQHWLAERVFDWSGLNVTHIRPTYFAEWLLYLAPMLKQGDTIYGPFTTGRHAPIAGEDQGRVIAGILSNPEPHRGKIYPLYGLVEHTYDEIAEIMGQVLGRTVRYQHVPIEKFAEITASAAAGSTPGNNASSMYSEADRITGRPGNEYLMQHLGEVARDHTNGLFAGTNNYVEEIGGNPPLGVEQFLRKHRSSFD
jgi:NAD(P)H dehydrogenase (quinone)